MKALVLAAGYATRMYPLAKSMPKPLLDVGGKPIAEHIIRRIEQVREIGRIYIVTNGKFFPHFSAWAAGLECSKPVEVLNDGSRSEADRLGALGDIRFAVEEKKIDDDLLVVGGDNLFGFSLNDFLKDFREKNISGVALRDLHSKDAVREKFGVALVENSLVADFEEKPKSPKSSLAATCIYIFTRNDLKMLGDYISEGNDPDKSGSFIQWLHKRRKVSGFVFDGEWHDIGSMEGLELARKEFRG